MDKWSKAKVLLKSMYYLAEKIEIAESNIDSDYSPSNRYLESLYNEQERLSKLVVCYLTDSQSDDEFLNELFSVNGAGSYDFQFNYAINFLNEYIAEKHPVYFDDLLENARNLRDLKNFSCSALCIRLFCESVIKKKYPKFLEYKTPTLGLMLKEIKNDLDLKYDIISSKQKRIDSIVHNDKSLQANPVTQSELTSLIDWANEFEKLLSINDVTN